MDLSRLDHLDAEGLREYIEFLLWHYRVMDSFWFIKVAERYGQPVAEAVNEEVWGRISGMAAGDLVRRFRIEKTGLAGFAEALRLFPWTILVGYEIEETDDEITVTVPVCVTQEARRKRGLGEYACRDMHRLEFEGLAQAVDPRILVHCDVAPPDDRPPGLDCRWRFTLSPAEEASE